MLIIENEVSYDYLFDLGYIKIQYIVHQRISNVLTPSYLQNNSSCQWAEAEQFLMQLKEVFGLLLIPCLIHMKKKQLKSN